MFQDDGCAEALQTQLGKQTMNPIFEKLYRQVGRVTVGLLLATVAFYGVTLVCALLGLRHAATSFGGVAGSLAIAFMILFVVFLMASVVAAIIRWFDRRSQTKPTAPI